jgi:hypothetical protein
MSLEELEARLSALEKTVAELQSQSPTDNGEATKARPEVSKGKEEFLREEDLIPGAEYDLVFDVPPSEVFTIKARIVSVEQAPAELSLTDEEWQLYGSEDDDE